jgi:large subunit ribosomal protein L25
MATVKELKASARPRGSKGAARAERREGRVPGIIYGDSKEPTAISVDRAELHQRILAGHFMTTLHDIEIDGTKHRVIPRDYQLDPVKDLPVHVDFMRLGEGAQIRVNIPIHIRNADQSPGLKRGGTINIVTHAVEVRVPADAIPESIDVDLTGVDIGHSRHLSDVELPANVKVIGRRDLTLVTIVAPSGYLEEQKAAAEAAVQAAAAAAAAAEAGEGAEGAPAAPGAPAAGAPAAGGSEKK